MSRPEKREFNIANTGAISFAVTKKWTSPKKMSVRVADITGDFSFAYMKEAFVAALLVIVAKSDKKAYLKPWEDSLSENIVEGD
jgi:hypothetical protein